MRRNGLLLLLLAAVLATAWWAAGIGSRSPEGDDRPAVDVPERADEEEVPVFPKPVAQEEAALAVEQVAPVEQVAALESATPDPPKRLVVTIVHADGQPASGVVVLAATGIRALEKGVADAEGQVTLSGWSRSVELYVAGATWGPIRETLEIARGEHRIVLPGGAELAGVVRVNGLPPERQIPFKLMPEAESSEVPWQLRMKLRVHTTGRVHGHEWRSFRCDPEGHFRVTGLPSGWHGQIVCPQAYDFGGPWQYSIDVQAPDASLVLELNRRPIVRGRVLSPSGQPAEDAAVHFLIKYSDGSSIATGFFADANGNFEITMREPGVENVHIELSTVIGVLDPNITLEWESGLLTLDTGPLNGTHDHDLGDLVLKPTRPVRFLVTDPEDQPVAGAIAVADVDGAQWSQPTTDEGLGLLEGVPLTAESFQVHALRHQTAVVALQPDLEEPVPVVVEPCSVLEVRLRARDGRAPKGFRLRLTTHGDFYESEGMSFEAPDVRVHLGVSRSVAMASGGWPWSDGRIQPASLFVGVNESGSAVFSCINPGVVFTIELLDPAGGRVGPERTLSLTPREQHLLELTLPHEPAEVMFEVRSAEGLPVEGASVSTGSYYGDGPGGRGSVQTDAAGRARVSEVYADRIDVSVRAEGRSALRVEGVPIAGPLARVPLVMPPGREVMVEVVDKDGQVVPGVRVVALWQEQVVSQADEPAVHSTYTVRGKRFVSAKYRLRDLPPADVVLVAHIGDRSVEHPLADEAIEARILVPPGDDDD